MEDHLSSSVDSDEDDRNPSRHTAQDFSFRPEIDFGRVPSRRKKASLWVYVVAVIVVLAIINYFVRSQTMAIFSGGLLLGMLAMSIAMRVYKHK